MNTTINKCSSLIIALKTEKEHNIYCRYIQIKLSSKISTGNRTVTKDIIAVNTINLRHISIHIFHFLSKENKETLLIYFLLCLKTRD